MNAADNLPVRRLVYALLITLAAGSVAGHVLSVARIYEPHLFRKEGDDQDTRRGPWPRLRPEPTPSQGDNDRSRWDTVRALVYNGTYVIGHREFLADGQFRDSGIVTEDGWRTIDKVLRPQTHDFYSSKPPLLATLVAGEYWLLKQLFGWSITEQRWEVMPVILLTINWLPMIIYLAFLARLLEQFGVTDWGRLYVLAAASFGTLVTPFANTLNNHTVATFCALFTFYPALQIWTGRDQRASTFLWCGLFAGLTACNELPAAALMATVLLMLLLRHPGRTILLYVPAVAVPVAAFFYTNYLAVGQWRPAYDNFGSPWYEFAGSHWSIEPGQPKFGIDWAYLTESRATYGFHVLLGHHGLFSLFPVFLLAAAGMIYGLPHWRQALRSDVTSIPNGTSGRGSGYEVVGLVTLLLTAIVAGFYIGVVNDRNRNYGGWTCGPRWLMWLTPLLLLTMLPIADWLAGRRWGRSLAYVLLAISVFSASYPSRSAWRHPWLYNLMESQGWIHY
jgi:hypothetical protein